MTTIHVHEGCAYIGNPPEMHIKNAVHLVLQARTNHKRKQRRWVDATAWRYQETLAVFYHWLFHSQLASSLKGGVVMVTNSHCVLLDGPR